MSGNSNPIWLESYWQQKRLLTAERVSKAVEELHRTGAAITIAQICDAVRRIYGVSVSANTITRNALAYEVYKAHRAPRRVRMLKDSSLLELLNSADGPDKRSLRARIARLRRTPKDGLISRLIRLETATKEQKMVECRLREEIVRLTLASSATGGK